MLFMLYPLNVHLCNPYVDTQTSATDSIYRQPLAIKCSSMILWPTCSSWACRHSRYSGGSYPFSARKRLHAPLRFMSCVYASSPPSKKNRKTPSMPSLNRHCRATKRRPLRPISHLHRGRHRSTKSVLYAWRTLLNGP